MGSGSGTARRMTLEQIEQALGSIQQWTGTPAKPGGTVTTGSSVPRPPTSVGGTGFAGHGGLGVLGGQTTTTFEATPAVEGAGAKHLRKTQRHLQRGYDKAIAAVGGIGESARRDIGEQGVARKAGIEQDLTSRGLRGSSLGVQAAALSDAVTSSQMDSLNAALASTFSGLEVGKGTSLAAAEAHYSDQLLSAQQALAAIQGGVSFQGGSGLGPAIGAVAGGVAANPSGPCCFIMLEGRYGDGTMDDVVRRFRDEKMTERNRRGYYKVAEVLVPLMRKSWVARWAVRLGLCDPLVSYGKWYYGENRHGWLFAPVKSAWLGLFDLLGGETEFLRENGEYV